MLRAARALPHFLTSLSTQHSTRSVTTSIERFRTRSSMHTSAALPAVAGNGGSGVGAGGEASVKEQKQAVRSAVKAKLKLLSTEDMKSESKAICEQLLGLPSYVDTQRLGIYLHCQRLKEVDTTTLALAALRAGKRCYVPVVEDKNSNMLLLHLDDLADLVSVPPFGILEPPRSYTSGLPREDALEVAATAPLGILLMPGLGFDTTGHRLGRGGGYYDKMVSRIRSAATSSGLRPPLLVALAFCAQVVSYIPVEEYDEPVDVLITGSGMVPCSERGQEFVSKKRVPTV